MATKDTVSYTSVLRSTWYKKWIRKEKVLKGSGQVQAMAIEGSWPMYKKQSGSLCKEDTEGKMEDICSSGDMRGGTRP